MNDSEQRIPILIVDDNPDGLALLEHILKSDNYQIDMAPDGLAAVELVKKTEYAVIILDIQMPGRNGIKTAKEIKSNSSVGTNPIILITTSFQDEAWKRLGYEAGAVDFLPTPMDPNMLRTKVSVFAELYKSRKKLEKQSELIRHYEQEERNLILENSLDAVINMNEAGLITYWNKQAEIIFGWKKNEIIGKKLSETIIPQSYRQAHEEGLKTFLTTGIGPILNQRIEINAVRKNKTEFPVELTVTPIKKDGHYIFSAFLRDIELRKKEQLRIKTSEENLQKAVKARDEFITLCSHELKTPLTSLQINYQHARKMYKENNPKVFSPEAVIKRIDLTNLQISRMKKLIDNMLDVSSISSGKMEFKKKPVDLHNLIVEILDSFHEDFSSRGIKVIFSTDYSHPMIKGDPSRLEQAIGNILNNAIKYGKGKPVEIYLNSLHSEAFLSITDHGIGIEEGNIERIFGRYERAISPSEISGLGLGLYISRQIIETHNGNLSVKSAKEEGSTFIIKLPMIFKEASLSH